MKYTRAAAPIDRPNRLSLGFGLGLIVLVVVASLPLPIYTRQWHLFLHILGAILLIGNIVTAAVWIVLARFTDQARIIHFAAKTVNRADVFFTVPGVLLILLNGLVLAPAMGGGRVLGASWVVAALVLLGLSGAVWAGLLVRYQAQLVHLSADRDQLPAEFDAVFRKWSIWGGVATLLPLMSLLLMVFKPTLW